MPNIEHSVLVGDELHEPKGISTADTGKVYVSDGAGSGQWKTLYTASFEDYGDTGTPQNLTNGSFVDLTNDGASAFTTKEYKIPDGRGDIWNPSTNTFDWTGAGLELGDTVDIRFDIEVTTVNTNDDVILAVDMSVGGTPYTLDVLTLPLKDTGTYQVTAPLSIYMGNSATLDYPAKVSAYTDANGNSIVVNGWYVRVIPRMPVAV